MFENPKSLLHLPFYLPSSAIIPLFLSRLSISQNMSTVEEYRIESDTFGDLKVPANVYWGAQTQR